MVLHNVSLLNHDHPVSIEVDGQKITAVSHKRHTEPSLQLHFEGALAFPGLINSHDHLDFNCFPMTGDRVYTSYVEWGNTVLQTYKPVISEVLKIPEPLRTQWGVYKNLLTGITTVVNHGKRLSIEKPLIRVLQNAQSLHSVMFENNWKLKLNNPLQINKPCAIHTGEGTDVGSFIEIDTLIKNNFLKRNLIGIHGVAMNERQASKFKALVWCPQSNYFLLQKTAAVNMLQNKTHVCFGTDSTLTSNWNIWDHLRQAREREPVKDAELFEMLTSIPASVWKLNSGKIEAGKNADIVIAETRTNTYGSFYNLNPGDIQLVIQNGMIRLFDEKIFTQLKKMNFDITGFSRIEMGRYKYVEGDLPGLIKKIKSYDPNAAFPFN